MLHLTLNRTISFDFVDTDYTDMSFFLVYVDVNKGKRDWEI